jgi:hypothetical protein
VSLLSGEILQRVPTLNPVDRHQGQDEVCRIQWDTAGVDSLENLGDDIDIKVSRQHQNRELVVLDVFKLLDVRCDNRALVRRYLLMAF